MRKIPYGVVILFDRRLDTFLTHGMPYRVIILKHTRKLGVTLLFFDLCWRNTR
jgi:hypothetical protein